MNLALPGCVVHRLIGVLVASRCQVRPDARDGRLERSGFGVVIRVLVVEQIPSLRRRARLGGSGRLGN